MEETKNVNTVKLIFQKRLKSVRIARKSRAKRECG